MGRRTRCTNYSLSVQVVCLQHGGSMNGDMIGLVQGQTWSAISRKTSTSQALWICKFTFHDWLLRKIIGFQWPLVLKWSYDAVWENLPTNPQKAAKYLFHYPFSILEMHSVSVWEELGKTKLSSSGYAPWSSYSINGLKTNSGACCLQTLFQCYLNLPPIKTKELFVCKITGFWHRAHYWSKCVEINWQGGNPCTI